MASNAGDARKNDFRLECFRSKLLRKPNLNAHFEVW